MENWRTSQQGFSLLEMLIALTVLGLLLVALVKGVRTGLDLWDAQARRTSEVAELDSAARVLRGILTTIPIEPAALGAPVAIGFKGQANQIALVGALPTGLGFTGWLDMKIYARGGHLMVSWTRHRHDELEAPAATQAARELMRGVNGAEFAYWGNPNPRTSPAWYARWEGPDLPALIRLRVQYDRHDSRRWPDLVVAPALWSPQ